MLLAEVVLRLFYPAPYYGYNFIPPQQQLFEYDPLVGWRGRPDTKGIFAGMDYYVSVSHDRYGYRNTTEPFIAGKENYLVVGDSFGWGWGVQDDELFSHYIVERQDRINIYNLSAPGYGTDQEYLTLKRFLEDTEDAEYKGVILLFYYNDFQDILRTDQYSYPKPRFVRQDDMLVLENVPVPRLKEEEYDKTSRDYVRRGGDILRHSHLFNLIRRGGASLVRRAKEKSPRQNSTPKAPPVRHDPAANQELAVSLLAEMDSLCKRSNMLFHVIFLVTSNISEYWQRELERLAAKLDAIDIEHSHYHSRAFPNTDLWMDKHLSPYGHHMLASHILDILP